MAAPSSIPPLSPAPVAPKKKAKAPKVLGVLALAALGVGAYVYISRQGTERTDDAQVEAHVASVAPRIAGQVKKVHVVDNQLVKAGDVLLELDDRDQQVRLAAAQADLAAMEAQLKTQQTQLTLVGKTAKANVVIAQGGVEQASAMTGTTAAGIAQATAAIAAAQSHKTLTKIDRDRTDRLLASGAVTRAEADGALAADEQADAQLAQARAQLASARANRSNAGGSIGTAKGRLEAASTVDEQVGAAEAQVALGEARVAQARTAVDRAQLDLDYTKVRAEIGGTVARRNVEPGQIVGPDRPLLALVDLTDTWIVANLKETQLASVVPGQVVDIELDAYDGELHGKVESIAAGTGSRFSLLPADNASGNFIKVTQRVPVKILLDAGSRKAVQPLRPGMSARVVIHLE